MSSMKQDSEYPYNPNSSAYNTPSTQEVVNKCLLYEMKNKACPFHSGGCQA